MKKFWLWGVLLLVIFVAGCSWWWKKEDSEVKNVTSAGINAESCNDYFELVNCIIDNDTDESYSQEERDLIREGIADMRESWASLDEDTVEEMCDNELSTFTSDSMRDYLSQIGCSLN